jgi:hypothetical protein
VATKGKFVRLCGLDIFGRIKKMKINLLIQSALTLFGYHSAYQVTILRFYFFILTAKERHTHIAFSFSNISHEEELEMQVRVSNKFAQLSIKF